MVIVRLTMETDIHTMVKFVMGNEMERELIVTMLNAKYLMEYGKMTNLDKFRVNDQSILFNFEFVGIMI